jgi:thymidylate synthase ThyX
MSEKLKISAKVIADSVSPAGKRICTLQLCYPRFIHSELMTHRAFSRNAMSSRAVPVAKMIDQVLNDPAMPIYWGANQAGMQAGQEVQHVMAAKDRWIAAAKSAASWAHHLYDLGLHKQITNRLLEPFQWMHTIVTATEWGNFFALRDHPAAQPEFRELAQAMSIAMSQSTPTLRYLAETTFDLHDWHLPYVFDRERVMYRGDVLLKISAARCARVSYLNHDGSTPNVEKDIELYKRLVGSEPLHASPVEHQAFPVFEHMRSRNFVGWRQHREILEREGKQ